MAYSYVDDSATKFFRINAKIKLIFNMIDLDNAEVIVYKRKRNVMGTYYKRVTSFIFNPWELHETEPEFHELYITYYEPLRRHYAIQKGEKLRDKMDRKKQLIFAAIIGYLCARDLKMNIPEFRRTLREILEIQFDTNVFTGLKRKAVEVLGIEYNSSNSQQSENT